MTLRRRQEGVALAIVVWFLAAMSLLVSGIVFQARVDTRLAQLHAASAKAMSAGDGAIQLTLAELAFGDTAGDISEMSFVIGDYPVTVRRTPISIVSIHSGKQTKKEAYVGS